MSSDSEIDGPQWTYNKEDESTFPRTRVWEKGRKTGWNKGGDGVFVVGTRLFCAACFKETGSGIRPHAEVKKGRRAGKRSATCMEHELKLVTEGKAVQSKLLKSIGSDDHPRLHERVLMADPIYFAAPITFSTFDRIKKKASTGD